MPDKPVTVVGLPLEPYLEDRLREATTATFLPGVSNAEDVLPHLAAAEGVLVSNQLVADLAFFKGAPRLRVLSGVGVGYDRCDVLAATDRKIAVCNTPGVLSGAVAELTIAFIYMLNKRIVDHVDYVRSGRWARREQGPPLGHDAAGQRLGLIGYGRIGREVARRAQALGMETVFYDTFTQPPDDATMSAYLPLDELLRTSDIVSVHVDLNADTHHLLSTRQFAQMQPHAYFINTSRGPVVDQAALTAALKQGTIAVAALDVFEDEPVAENEELVTLPNVIATPHMATATEETRRAMRELAVDNLLAGLKGELPPACVNPEVLV